MTKPPSIPLPLLIRAAAALKAAKETDDKLTSKEWAAVANSFNELDYYVGVIAGYTNVETTA